MSVNRYPLRALLLGLLTMALLACGGEEEQPPAPPTPEPAAQAAAPTPPPVPERRIKPQQEAGQPLAAKEPPSQQLRRTVPLPDDYPEDAPNYPGSEPSQIQRGGDGRMVVMFGTDDSLEQVAGYMNSYLPGAGWSVSGEQDLPTGKLIQATKGDRLVSVLLSRLDEDKSSAITLIAVSVDS